MTWLSRLFLLVLYICPSQTVISQETGARKSMDRKPVYNVGVQMGQKKELYGFLYLLTDSGVYVISRKDIKAKDTSGLFFIPVTSIQEIRFRKKGAVLTGMLAGAFTGGLMGYGIVYTTYKNETGFIIFGRDFWAAIGGLAVGKLGLIAGALIGNRYPTRFAIHGDSNKYQLFRPEMETFAIGPFK